MGLLRTYGTFCIGFGLYGFSRGLRVDENRKDFLHTYNAVINGVYYALPPWQFTYIKSLLNRIELHKLGYSYKFVVDKTYYTETNGLCWDTI